MSAPVSVLYLMEQLHFYEEFRGVFLVFFMIREHEAMALIESYGAGILFQRPEVIAALLYGKLQQLRANAAALQDGLHKQLFDLFTADADEALDHAVIIDPGMRKQFGGILIVLSKVRYSQFIEIVVVIAKDGVKVQSIAEDFDFGEAGDVSYCGFTDMFHTEYTLSDGILGDQG